MSILGGAATQVCAPQFDRHFFSLPEGTQRQIQRKIDELGAICAIFRTTKCREWMRSGCGLEISASFTSSILKRIFYC